MAEGDALGHFGGHSGGKGTDLLMDVHGERVGLPPSHFLNGEGVNAVEVHGHGSPGSKGVAADIVRCVAELVEANVSGGSFESVVDLVRSHLSPCGKHWVFVVVDGGGGGAAVAENVVDATG